MARSPVRIERRAASLSSPEIEVRSSARRRKTATAWWEGELLIVAMPAHVKGIEREELIDWLVARSSKRRPAARASDPDLLDRALRLAKRYELGVAPSSVRFVGNMSKRWGSCTSVTGEIRISDRLRMAPGWVLDAVVVHELCHLAVPDHSPAFHELANRFERQGEASTFLEGFQLGLDAPKG